MKSLVRKFLFSLISLYIAFYLIKGFSYDGDPKTLLKAALILTLINIFIKPLINLFMLPLNFLSLGLFSLLSNVIVLYLLTYFTPQVKILPWFFPGISYSGFTIPPLNFSVVHTYFLTALLISLILNFLNWLCHK